MVQVEKCLMFDSVGINLIVPAVAILLVRGIMEQLGLNNRGEGKAHLDLKKFVGQ